jgi:hypothetical protein
VKIGPCAYLHTWYSTTLALYWDMRPEDRFVLSRRWNDDDSRTSRRSKRPAVGYNEREGSNGYDSAHHGERMLQIGKDCGWEGEGGKGSKSRYCDDGKLESSMHPCIFVDPTLVGTRTCLRLVSDLGDGACEMDVTFLKGNRTTGTAVTFI